jgi:hypothetical protein
LDLGGFVGSVQHGYNEIGAAGGRDTRA